MGANEGPIVAIDEKPCRICVYDQVIDLKWTEYDLMGYQGWYLPTETTNPAKKDKKKILKVRRAYPLSFTLYPA